MITDTSIIVNYSIVFNWLTYRQNKKCNMIYQHVHGNLLQYETSKWLSVNKCLIQILNHELHTYSLMVISVSDVCWKMKTSDLIHTTHQKGTYCITESY